MGPYTVFNVSFDAWVLKSLFEDIARDMDGSTMANGAPWWCAW
jgi:ABC-type glycerol-3-phosphate transport system permease component